MTISNPTPIFDENRYLVNQNKNNMPYPDDFYKAREFLLAYKNSKDTFKTYRREVERLCQWAWYIENRSFTQLKRSDIERYLAFCQKPPKRWIGFSRPTRFVTKDDQRLPNPQWRPFVVSASKAKRKQSDRIDKADFTFSQEAMKSLLLVLSSFYNFLIAEEHIEYNPILTLRQKSHYVHKTQTQSPVRRLSQLQIQYLQQTAINSAEKNTHQHERNIFVISLMLFAYVRISELTVRKCHTPLMSDFYRDNNKRWWYRVIGKGNKERRIAVSDTLLASLTRWRIHLGLSPLPSPRDKTPLLPKSKGQGGLSNAAYLREQIQSCFDKTIEALRRDRHCDEAELLENATPHWLRHTGISLDVDQGRPLSHIKDDAGHADIQTTSRYIDADSTARHQSARAKTLKS